jgi:acetolactate synthase-1/2/3 large subunit
MQKISGAKIMTLCLKNEGVNTVFGYPGAAIAPFYEELAESGLRHVLMRGEQGAGHAANGYARMTGKPGVCVATSGPGATNLFTAIATAYSDSIPMIAITGQAATYQLGRDVFQEIDATGAAEPFTKYAYLVKSAGELAQVFKEAFHIASTGRRGPVLIDVPVDVQEQLAEFDYPKSVNIRGYKPRQEGHPLQVKRLAEAIARAKRPALCFGGGVFLADAVEELRRFVVDTQIPAVSTMMGLGALPPGDALYYGMVGQSGRETANFAVEESDLLILLGARVGDRAISRFARDNAAAREIAHIDIDTAEIGKNLDTTIPLVGDLKAVLGQLLDKNPHGVWADWRRRLDSLRGKELPSPSLDSDFDPGAFVRALCEKLPENSVYVADVGQNQIWSARSFTGKGRFLTTGGMGTMGYSIPAAIGAKLASPKSEVVAVCGDGAFQMSMQEIASMLQNNAPVKIVVMRNDSLGLVRDIQLARPARREFAVALEHSPDLRLLAEAYGIPYGRLENNAGIEAAAQRIIEAKGAYLLECIVR